jgi:hypothetical protein
MQKYFSILSTILASSYGFTLIQVHKCFVPNTSSFSTTSLSLSFRKDTTTPNSRLLFTSYFATTNKDDEDDGWGSPKVMSSSDSNDMKRELEALKSDRDFKKANSDGRVLYSSQSSINNNSSTEKERDLFIPIFAIVSLAGLFGAYGYEMLRLNAQGELYLPWRQ